MSSDPKLVSGADPKLGTQRNALIEALAPFFERRVERKSDVPDLVQDVFLRLIRLDGLSGIDEPESYIFTTALSAHPRGRGRAGQRGRS